MRKAGFRAMVPVAPRRQLNRGALRRLLAEEFPGKPLPLGHRVFKRGFWR